jgi:hypothetical protein
VMLMFKHVTPEVHPQPNCSRHEWAAWDAYILTSDPDSGPSTFRSPAPSSRSAVRAPGSLRAEAGQGAAVIWPACHGRDALPEPPSLSALLLS